MKRFALVCIIMLAAGLLWPAVAQWSYVREIKLPASDTAFVRPYLCAVDANGRLYMISSKATDALAHNAIYYADPSDTVFKVFIDFDKNGDSDTLTGNIGALRGVATVGTDVIINASQPYPKTAPSTISAAYYYSGGDTNQVYKLVATSAATYGHGTFTHGFVLTRDTIAVGGVSAGAGVAGPRIRFFDFRRAHTTATRGQWYAEAQLEPGGAHTGGFDIIRDCAVVPGGDYSQSTTPIYSSRNSLSAAQATGGIALWTGGTTAAPSTYAGQRVADAIGFLSLGTFIPTGITVDHSGLLWVARGDSASRWVKAFDMSAGIFAQDVDSLTGAPMLGPCDVAITANGARAYVVDYLTRSAFLFVSSAVGVEERPTAISGFVLKQNYPNPFNPVTSIAFTLPAAADVRLVVTNQLGQEIAVLAQGTLSAGTHVRAFAAGDLPTGVYFYTLEAGSIRQTRSMLLLK